MRMFTGSNRPHYEDAQAVKARAARERSFAAAERPLQAESSCHQGELIQLILVLIQYFLDTRSDRRHLFMSTNTSAYSIVLFSYIVSSQYVFCLILTAAPPTFSFLIDRLFCTCVSYCTVHCFCWSVRTEMHRHAHREGISGARRRREGHISVSRLSCALLSAAAAAVSLSPDATCARIALHRSLTCCLTLLLCITFLQN